MASDSRASGNAGSGPSSSNYSWRNPPPDKQKKFGVIALGDSFEPTPQEQSLLNMYDTIKAYEKHAAFLKKDAAIRKLQDRNAAFLQNQSKRKTKRAKKKAAAAAGSDNDDDDVSDDDEDEDSEDDDDLSQTIHEKREAKLEEMRQEVEDAKAKQGAAAKEKEEEMIAEHLMENADNDDGLRGTVLTKKRKTEDGAQSSLLFNMKPEQTPQHEFSSKLELEARGGTFLFPKDSADDDDLMRLAGDERKKVWEPPEGAIGPNDGAFLEYLEDFDVDAGSGSSNGNNTVAIKFEVPQDSRRFSFNVAQANQADQGFESILFHFNPRQRGRGGGQVVMNDKEDGIWGQNLSVPLSQLPVIFGKEALTLQIQIHQDGFDVFMDDVHCARLEHRQDLLAEENNRLCLQFPSTDDYGSPENWKVFKVWWGYKPLMAKSEKLASIPGVNSFNSVHPRKLFLRGLPKIIPKDAEIRRAELERAFAKYGGSRGLVKVVVYSKKTFATVELETERLADLALQEMSSVYQINRARRTKHEALQEEREAKEKAAAGVRAHRDMGGWD